MTTKRCTWVSMDDPLMLQYHDREWGVPVHDDRRHFEFLVLEAAQAGLNWSIVLKKREGYRRAFSEFDPVKVARYTEKRIQKLTLDPAIIRNRMKIEAAVRNARAFLAIQEEMGSFDAYCWRFVDGRPKLNRWKAMREIPATSRESDAFSKDLKHRGFTLRWFDHYLCAHAGDRHGERSPRRLFSISRGSAAGHCQSRRVGSKAARSRLVALNNADIPARNLFVSCGICSQRLAAWKAKGYPLEPYQQPFHLDTAT